MNTNKPIFRCCKNDPTFVITYSVADEQKTYQVCESCTKLDCFNKFIIKKEYLKSSVQGIVRNELSMYFL